VQSTRLACARALVEVAWILVQKRWQYGAADHDVGKAVGIGRTEALAVTLRILAAVGIVCCLIDAGKRGYADDGNRIEEDPGGELELQLRGKRSGIVMVDDVEIGNDAENALLLFGLDLLGGDLLGRSSRGSHNDCRERLSDMEFAAGQDCVLAWLEDDGE
jgi:hypothetical protein